MGCFKRKRLTVCLGIFIIEITFLEINDFMNGNIYILGVSAFYHDSAAALIKDGIILSAAQEERFTRIKGDESFPVNAITFCLNEAELDISELEAVVFYESPYIKFDRLHQTNASYWPDTRKLFMDSFPLWSSHRLKISKKIREGLGDTFLGEIYFTDHHLSHAASAFFPSPFEEAAILTLDAVGEWSTSTIGSGKGNKVDLLHEMRFPHSIGMLYSAFTYYTGFK